MIRICIFLFSRADIEQVERNESHVTLQCKTNLHQIIWKIGKTRRFEAQQYERSGSFVIATTTILVKEAINISCIGKNRSSSEMAFLPLYPCEGLCNLNTTLTHC